MAFDYVSKTGLAILVTKIKESLGTKVDKVDGMGLSKNDFTDELKTTYNETVTKVSTLEAVGAQENTIETVKVNGSALIPDEDKAVNISLADYATKTDLDGKVSTEAGKGLSTNDYTTAEKAKLEGIDEGAQVNVIETVKVNNEAIAVTNKAVNIDLSTYAKTSVVDGKVDKVDGKGLSTNDYTTAEKEKLEGITAGAQPNVIETVKLNGAALTVTDKAVNIALTTDNITNFATATADFATKAEVTSAVSSVYKVKGSVANFAALPTENNTAGDVYNLTDTGMNYVWTGSEWDALGSIVDLSPYAQTADFVEITTAEINAMWAGE